MSQENILLDIIIFFAVTIIFVPLFRRMKLGNVFGYLVAGIVVGPYGLGFIKQQSNVFQLADIGLLLLLFVIGQELSPRRLSALKSKIAFDGGAQFVLTSFFFFIPTYFFIENMISAVVISMGLSLSSTAFVLSYLKDSKQLTRSYGQMSFSILLFQDIIIVPILTLLPFLSMSGTTTDLTITTFLTKLAIIVSSFAFLKFCLKPLLSIVQKESHEVFTAFCLLVIIGMAFVMDNVGLSKALGAFIAGIFFSDSEFKKDIESVINPFKGMLMGVFFLTFGLKFNLDFFYENIFFVIALCIGVMGAKAVLFYALGRYRFKDGSRSKKLALIMCQGGEFSLIVFAISQSHGIISETALNFLVCSMILSLFLAPILAKISESIVHLEEVQPTETPSNKLDNKPERKDVEEGVEETKTAAKESLQLVG